jgi:LysM repeat protein
VFLIAVIALVGIVAQSGVLGGSAEPSPTPTPKATKTKTGQAKPTDTKKYTVKSGDTLSGIAATFDSTVAELESLNPDLSSGTLVVGDKILVPKP